MTSPLRRQAAKSVSVCGKMLRAGQILLVLESAVGPRERKMAEKGKISLRASNVKGMTQIVCMLKE